ncbi:DNA recombination protein RmuC [Ferrovum sp.]|uniref:DNA recombination protein RmuC n=1 Tax=Ferrovum sp. TaxID=2609467 RepID=UPI00260C55DF|nr:DNA recombination protein RmuC [Ferrovum sp.]
MEVVVVGILSLALGALLSSLIWRSRLAVCTEKGRSEGAVERTQWMERASRLPELERRLSELEQALNQARDHEHHWHLQEGRLSAELTAEQARCQRLVEELNEARQNLQREVNEHRQHLAQVAELQTRLEAERRQAGEKIVLLQEARDELSLQFKNLANDILEEKSRHFKEQNENSLGQLLNPLRERLGEFGTKVEEIHRRDTEQQAQLKAELGHLKALNQQMSVEAHQLATALKGQAKKQGNWGELVLENLLDRSGLREGQDYRREVSFTTEEGRRRPDVIVYLPQSKHLVIDAKVSLNAYTRYVNAEEDAERAVALKEHVQAVAARIQELSDRSYFTLPNLNTPEMVFMFIPIESAFVEALRADDSLFQKAIEKNVLVATPTTLMTSLNIVRQLWRFEEQNAHTAELAERAGRVYKKLVGFVASMEQVGKELEKARTVYDKAYGQLHSGKGNLIAQAREFERLGVSIQARLPEDLVAKAALELETHAENPELP